jgi:release factor glutamine methyltransferase
LWIVGGAAFAGLRVRVDVGVYVPRPHTEALALRAVEPLPADGTAVDLCTGSGAVVAVLADRRPGATILATDVDERAVACARATASTLTPAISWGHCPSRCTAESMS